MLASSAAGLGPPGPGGRLSPLASADFIEEAPTLKTGITHIATMSPVTFSSARVNGAGAGLTADQRVLLVQNNQQDATPSLPNAEGNGFSVGDGDIAPSVPYTTTFQRHRDGSVWAWSYANGIWTPLPGTSPVIAMAASPSTILRLDNNGQIWESYLGANWQMIDNYGGIAQVTVPNGT